MPDVTIEIIANGPIFVEGEVKLIGPDEQTIEHNKKRIFLCRCGQSKIKPYCDGTHKDIGFNVDNIEVK